jgi:hypothetical protein
MHEFIRIHRQRLNEAFGLSLRCAPSYTGLRGILQGVDGNALEAAYRAHAASIASAPEGHWAQKWIAIAVDGKTLRGSSTPSPTGRRLICSRICANVIRLSSAI